MMANLTFPSSCARALLRIADDRGMRLRDIGATFGITEPGAYGIVTDLAEAGYVVKRDRRVSPERGW
jgi:DNA-binding IclR family transcriptional regulator